MDTKLYYSRAEVAQMIGVSMRTLDRMRQDCTAPRETLIGRTVKFSVIDVKAWVKEHQHDN